MPGAQIGAITVVGLTDFGGLMEEEEPAHYNAVDGQASYSGEKISGAHSLSFGASFDRILLGEEDSLDANGDYQFSSLGNFLAGKSTKLIVMSPGTGTLRHWAYNEFAGYHSGQLAHQPPAMSVGFGVRYETATTPLERERQSGNASRPAGGYASLPWAVRCGSIRRGSISLRALPLRGIRPAGAAQWCAWARASSMICWERAS